MLRALVTGAKGHVTERVRAAAEGCDLVFHTAAVYDMSGKTAAEVVEPAVVGTRNVFAAAAATGVGKRTASRQWSSAPRGSPVPTTGGSRHPWRFLRTSSTATRCSGREGRAGSGGRRRARTPARRREWPPRGALHSRRRAPPQPRGGARAPRGPLSMPKVPGRRAARPDPTGHAAARGSVLSIADPLSRSPRNARRASADAPSCSARARPWETRCGVPLARGPTFAPLERRETRPPSPHLGLGAQGGEPASGLERRGARPLPRTGDPGRGAAPRSSLCE